jgi:hypothetical protein
LVSSSLSRRFLREVEGGEQGVGDLGGGEQLVVVQPAEHGVVAVGQAGLHGQDPVAATAYRCVPSAVRDVDVARFDPDDLSRDRDERATAALALLWPDLTWEAIGQAVVAL